ncbi:integrin beta-1-B-like isoform X2 [Ostrea edulis]|uniref:integrin beta-1-B-like isoform X2 n=1 Tax=Ostrea edulis TaxID=37623 RepID=UPI0020965846|nr:integrin beta-1-B-like isoform X2 [Ostrea edulis]XP_056008310.1 integrin beta-1-B-like isoform X2 [Ostrea edulis]
MLPSISTTCFSTFLCLIIVLGELAAQDLRTDSLTPTQENPCLKEKTTTCGECIAISTLCAFCTDAEYDTNNYPRCDLLTTHQKLINDKPRCKDIVNPSSVLTKSGDERLVDGDRNKYAVQIRPQEIDLELRPNDPQNFELTFRLAENYPVDLYYLMDLSNSMADDKEKLASLGVKIAEDMSTITKNFKLGFGSFVDKVVMPYVSTAPNKINNPCPGCEKAYGFRNVMKLDINSTIFRDKVRAAKVSGNLDAPEGGFDAIMQAVACESEIGWRNRSRRMLLFSTDAGFHYAGDGKLGGIVKPNDGDCHLSGSGMYTESSNQDYPSISQVAVKAKEKNVNIIFAVTADQKPIYDQLKPIIAGSETGVLASDSQNIVKLVRDNYLAITSKVELIVENSDNVDVKFKSRCKGSVLEATNKCENLSIGESVKFNVTLEVKNCPPKGEEDKILKIKPVGLYDTLTIKLRIKCECDCESEKEREDNKNHVNCNYNGTFVCGMCVCNEPFFGEKCDCDKGTGTIADKERECIQDKNTTIICNGRGECNCGKCTCRERQKGTSQFYTGTFCECDDYSCPYFSGLICGGLSRGQCNCGTCECQPGFTGKNCGCSTDNSTCMYNGELCNGQGTCECGKCTCTNPKYFGPQCQECDNCGDKQCRTHRDCALCTGFNSGDLTREQCEKQCGHTKAVPKLSNGITNCEFVDSNGCFIYFTYFYDKDNILKVEVQKDPECPPEVNVLAIVLGVIAGIVFFGVLLLLIWKLFTTISDKRELARFEKEAQNAKWDTGENPIYKQATSTFVNPTYRQ